MGDEGKYIDVFGWGCEQQGFDFDRTIEITW